MRSSGILLHVTSLPSRYGVGTLEQVGKFIRFLKKSKQSYWQILPVAPCDSENSPYASLSAFAGNTLLIDVLDLKREGLLSDKTLKICRTAKGNDYCRAKKCKEIMLREAYSNFIKLKISKDYAEFVSANEFWLKDYALFCVLKDYFGGKSWQEWDDEKVRLHDADALKVYSEKLIDEINYIIFCQYVFFTQWKNFRAKLKRAHIKLIGDIPIYVSYDSSDVWAHPELFRLTEDRRPAWVAGVPPDYFSEDGQLWGNPLYNWDAMKSDNYRWWTARVKKCAELFDVLRIDHFRAFDSYYEIPYGQTTAREGRWQKGVGYEFLKHIIDSVPQLTIVAEDLGDIPQSVLELRDKCGLDGMKVVQFGFDGDSKNAFLPQNFDEHCVAYLGTHDNDTTQGWWNGLDENSRKIVLAFSGLESGEHIAHNLMVKLAESKAELVIYCMQDISELGSSARMNTPGTLGCWRYMAKTAEFSDASANRLAKLTEDTRRCVE